jgi:ABC-type proline/glycine betaine transport system permease subunit
MQTIPAFSYLVPVVLLFGISSDSADRDGGIASPRDPP